MRTSRLFAWGMLASSFAWLLAGGCSAEKDPLAPLGTAGSTPTSDAQPDGLILKPDSAGTDGDGGNTLNPLCGAGTCIPDDQSSSVCRTYVPPAHEGGAGGEAGQASGTGGEGEGGVSGGGASSEGGVDQGGAGQGGAGQGGAGQGGVDQGSAG
ncbi:MAG TPA: hypothetical protein VIW29_16220, partial [Polyangiaceae bacterium]